MEKKEVPRESESMDVRTLVAAYSKQLLNQTVSFFHASPIFLGKIWSYIRTTSPRRRACLPLPLPSGSLDSLRTNAEASEVFDVLEDIFEHVYLNLHNIQKNLDFWQSRAEGSNAQKLYFMIFERGPWAFIDGTRRLLYECIAKGSPIQLFCCSASTHMSERITMLANLRYVVASFLAQVYTEVDRFGDELLKDPEKSLFLLIFTVNDLFSQVEALIGHLHAMHQMDSSVDGSYSFPLLFEKLPEANQLSQCNNCEIKDVINLIYRNLHRLGSFLSSIVEKNRKPRKITLYWFHYTCGVVGLSACSVWLLRHSSYMGSSDIDNWIHEAKDSTVSFWNDHVEQPLLSIRDELFDTFRKRHKGVMELEEVQLTEKSLHRMLLAFVEQTKGQTLPANASDQQMLEVVMARYEKELMHPIQNLVGGELVRALLIQVQKLKLDIETAMLELDQILKANEINFAILAALPAFALSLILLMLLRAWFIQDTRAEGRGRIARIQRRLLIVEVERRIMQYQTCLDQGLEKDADCMFGLMLYSLDRLYQAVQWHSKATGEWLCLRQDIVDLGKPGIQTVHKLRLTSRMERLYDCLLPASKRQ